MAPFAEQMNGSEIRFDVSFLDAALPGLSSDRCELQSFRVVPTSGKPDESAAKSTFAIKEE